MTLLEFTCEGKGLIPTGTGSVGDSLMVTIGSVRNLGSIYKLDLWIYF
jgi:hypothetical protein